MSLPPAPANTGPNRHGATVIDIRLLHVPDCPLVDELKLRLDRCLSSRGLSVDVEEIEGPYPSPTLLIDGADVTGRPVSLGPSCRLDSPTEEQIIAALTRSRSATEASLIPEASLTGHFQCRAPV